MNWRMVMGLVFVIAAIGPAREIVRNARDLRHDGVPAELGARYAALAAYLPMDARLGYVSDLDATDQKARDAFYSAAYALPPRIVHWGTDEPLVIADLFDASKLPAICGENHLRVVRMFGPGLALLEAEPRQ
ncbi:MAG: hypothetical protein ABSG31_14115 [Tepidisphaeraceae bacterium]|jgi:hypothetical protein